MFTPKPPLVLLPEFDRYYFLRGTVKVPLIPADILRALYNIPPYLTQSQVIEENWKLCQVLSQTSSISPPNPSGVRPEPSQGKYCTQWIWTGDCAHIAQGVCKYKQEKPTEDEASPTSIPGNVQEKPRNGRPGSRPNRVQKAKAKTSRGAGGQFTKLEHLHGLTGRTGGAKKSKRNLMN